MTKNEFVHKISSGDYIFVYIGGGFSVTFGFSGVTDKYFIRFCFKDASTKFHYSLETLCECYFSLLEHIKDPKIGII